MIKVVILCGGKGTRLSEETSIKPKPMVKIGKDPIVKHIMKIYEYHGFKHFILALGYKGSIIKKYFKNYKSKITVQLVDTGNNTLTGGRILRLKKLFKKDETFMLTYGDGVSNINIKSLLKFHNKHGRLGTISAVRPPVRFGELEINKTKVRSFKEKPQASKGWINGGFFVLNSKIFDFIKNDKTVFEREPLEKMVRRKQLMAFKHNGYWQCMDTMRDKELLVKLWISGKAPWKKW